MCDAGSNGPTELLLIRERSNQPATNAPSFAGASSVGPRVLPEIAVFAAVFACILSLLRCKSVVCSSSLQAK